MEMQKEAKNEDTVSVTKLTMKIGDKKLELTVAEAQKMLAALKELFDKVQVTNMPNYPVIIWRENNFWDRNPYKPWPWLGPFISYCSSTGQDETVLNWTLEAK